MFKVRTKYFLLLGLLVTGTSVAEVIDGEELVDPTRPFQLAVGSDVSAIDLIRTVVPVSYDLSFIRAGGDSPMAIINQQQLTIGDVIGGAEVIAIDRSGVTLRSNSEEQRVNLYGASVKTNAVSQ